MQDFEQTITTVTGSDGSTVTSVTEVDADGNCAYVDTTGAEGIAVVSN